MKKFNHFFFCALLLSIIALHAQEKNFTFRIPVELYSIPADIKSFSVNVEIYDREFNAEGYPIPGSLIGYGNPGLIPIVDGEYVDTVVVSFNEGLRKDPAKAVFWSVVLTLFGPPGYQGGVFNAMGPDTPYPYDPTKPLVYALTGYIAQTAQSQQSPKKIDYPLEYLREQAPNILRK